MPNLSSHYIEQNLVDINNEKNIPDEVMSFFWKEKEERGGLAMGVSNVGDQWFVVSPSLEEYIMKSFEYNE